MNNFRPRIQDVQNVTDSFNRKDWIKTTHGGWVHKLANICSDSAVYGIVDKNATIIDSRIDENCIVYESCEVRNSYLHGKVILCQNTILEDADVRAEPQLIFDAKLNYDSICGGVVLNKCTLKKVILRSTAAQKVYLNSCTLEFRSRGIGFHLPSNQHEFEDIKITCPQEFLVLSNGAEYNRPMMIYPDIDNKIRVRIGCRIFTYKEAVQHWKPNFDRKTTYAFLEFARKRLRELRPDLEDFKGPSKPRTRKKAGMQRVYCESL